jgi:hypothetical protein
MITFWSPLEDSARRRQFFAAPPFKDSVRVVPYEDLRKVGVVGAGACIFAGLDQLSRTQTMAVTALWDDLAHTGMRLLNDPRKVRGRYDLLRGLFETGRNRFQVFRASEAARVERFPVFVRYENRHWGSLTGLLNTRAELTQALAWLRRRGHRLGDLLVVEFCNTADGAGRFRKYSAFRIGDVILAHGLMISPRWMVKGAARLRDDAAVREVRNYTEGHPHEAWLRELFDFARIDYGRVDYGMLGDEPQVWEINTDPTLGSMPGRVRPPEEEEFRAMLAPSRERFVSGFAAALQRLDRAAPSVRIMVPGRLKRRLAVEDRTRATGRLMLRLSHLFVESRPVQPLRPLIRATLGFAQQLAPIRQLLDRHQRLWAGRREHRTM